LIQPAYYLTIVDFIEYGQIAFGSMLWLAQVAPARPCFGAVTFVNL
jgi:hypothetical protein